MRRGIAQSTVRVITAGSLELKPVITFRYELLSDHYNNNNWKSSDS